jgi:hypothetical protein
MLTVQVPAQCHALPRGKMVGVPDTPLSASDPGVPLRDEVLVHLEDWSYADQGDYFGELTLSDEMLEHLEEWDHGGADDSFVDLTSARARADLPGPPPSPASVQTHPLWDRELDG